MKPGVEYCAGLGYSLEDVVLALAWLLAEMKEKE